MCAPPTCSETTRDSKVVSAALREALFALNLATSAGIDWSSATVIGTAHGTNPLVDPGELRRLPGWSGRHLALEVRAQVPGQLVQHPLQLHRPTSRDQGSPVIRSDHPHTAGSGGRCHRVCTLAAHVGGGAERGDSPGWHLGRYPGQRKVNLPDGGDRFGVDRRQLPLETEPVDGCRGQPLLQPSPFGLDQLVQNRELVAVAQPVEDPVRPPWSTRLVHPVRRHQSPHRIRPRRGRDRLNNDVPCGVVATVEAELHPGELLAGVEGSYGVALVRRRQAVEDLNDIERGGGGRGRAGEAATVQRLPQRRVCSPLHRRFVSLRFLLGAAATGAAARSAALHVRLPGGFARRSIGQHRRDGPVACAALQCVHHLDRRRRLARPCRFGSAPGGGRIAYGRGDLWHDLLPC